MMFTLRSRKERFWGRLIWRRNFQMTTKKRWYGLRPPWKICLSTGSESWSKLWSVWTACVWQISGNLRKTEAPNLNLKWKIQIYGGQTAMEASRYMNCGCPFTRRKMTKKHQMRKKYVLASVALPLSKMKHRMKRPAPIRPASMAAGST